jgi:hypothetical protein
MKSFAVFSLFASVALAQSLIPDDISDGCSSFLQQLDGDQSMTSCTNSLITATSAFGPGSDSASASIVNSALTNLCSSSSACSETTIRSTLANFYSSCTAELTSSVNPGVVQIYDVLYTIIPLTEATCSKDDSGAFCATKIQGNAPPAGSLYSGQDVLTPNFQALGSSNAAFLFLTPDLSSDKLCTSCTRSIMTQYVSFESDISYAPGLKNSILLGGQAALYAAISQTCGATFMNNAVQAAGSLSDGVISASGAAAAHSMSGSGVLASLVGAVSLAIAAAL